MKNRKLIRLGIFLCAFLFSIPGFCERKEKWVHEKTNKDGTKNRETVYLHFKDPSWDRLTQTLLNSQHEWDIVIFPDLYQARMVIHLQKSSQHDQPLEASAATPPVLESISSTQEIPDDSDFTGLNDLLSQLLNAAPDGSIHSTTTNHPIHWPFGLSQNTPSGTKLNISRIKATSDTKNSYFIITINRELIVIALDSNNRLIMIKNDSVFLYADDIRTKDFKKSHDRKPDDDAKPTQVNSIQFFEPLDYIKARSSGITDDYLSLMVFLTLYSVTPS